MNEATNDERILERIRDLLRQSDGLAQSMGTITIEFTSNARTANDLFDILADIGDNYGA
jgi:hypothetical protein